MSRGSRLQGGDEGDEHDSEAGDDGRGRVAVVGVLLEGEQARSAVGRDRVLAAVGTSDANELAGARRDEVAALKVAGVDGAVLAGAVAAADRVALAALELEVGLRARRRRERVLGLEEREEALELAVDLRGGVGLRHLGTRRQLAVAQIRRRADARTEHCRESTTSKRSEWEATIAHAR